jgi:hypothetical protein
LQLIGFGFLEIAKLLITLPASSIQFQMRLSELIPRFYGDREIAGSGARCIPLIGFYGGLPSIIQRFVPDCGGEK